MRLAGAAAMATGVSLGLLSRLFDALGMEEAEEVTSILAATMMGLSGVLTILPGLFTSAGQAGASAGYSV